MRVGLDVVGALPIPFVEDVANGVSAGISLWRGDYGRAGTSMLALAAPAGLNSVVGGSRALRRTGDLLESVEDVFANPQLLQGKSYAQVRGTIGNAEGWVHDAMRKSARAKGWVYREMNRAGTDFTDRLIQYHPGSPRHFGGRSYWKVSSGSGTVRIPLK